MREIFLRVLVISLTCSVVLAALLVFSKKLRGRYAGKTLYFLWLLLAIRMALPLPMMGRQAPVTVELPAYDVTIPAMPPSPPAAPKAPTAPWNPGARAPETAGSQEAQVTVTETVALSDLAATVWAAGAGLFLLWQMVAYWMARRSILRASCPATDDEWALLGRLCTDMNVGKALNLCRSARVESPMLLGLFGPRVVLPDRESDPDELEAELRHELCHLKRGDVAYKSFFLLVNALHWFNPLVWLMARAAARNVEFCCDDQVLRHADGPTRKHYGEVLLCTAAGSIYPAFSTHFGSGKEQLRERLLNLFQRKKNSALLVCAVAAVALLAGGAVAFESAANALPTSPVLYTRAYDPLLNEGHDGHEVAKLRVVEYDRVTDVLGADGEVQTFTMAEDVRLIRSDGGNTIWAGEKGSAERNRALFDFLWWPLLRSALYLDQTDLIEIILNDAGEIQQMRWIQTPGAAAEPMPGPETPVPTETPLPGASMPVPTPNPGPTAYETFYALFPDATEDVGSDNYETITFQVADYDAENGTIAGTGENRTLTMADGVRLARDPEGNALWAGEKGTIERQRALMTFFHWPWLRSTYTEGRTDFIEVIVENGQVAQMSLRLTAGPGAPGEPEVFTMPAPARPEEVVSPSFGGAVKLPVEGAPEVSVEPLPPDTGESKTVIDLSSGGQSSMIKSASFNAEAGQTLTLTVTSDISGGAVDLFLFGPDGKQQRVTIGGEDMTKTITLTKGTWAYNCTGFFESGSVGIVGTVK